VDRLHHPRADLEHLAVEGFVAADQLPEVVPGRERRPLTADDHDLAVGGKLLERGDHLAHERERERVPLVGAVERESGDGPLVADGEVVELHRCQYPASSPRRSVAVRPGAAVRAAQVRPPPPVR